MDGVMELLMLLIALWACIQTTFANDVNCYQDTSEQQLQRQCFVDQGIDVTFPAYEVDETSGDRKKNYVDAVIAQRPDQLCSQQEQFKTALECAMEHTIECMPTDYQGYLPQPNMMRKIVDKLCDNTTKINFECVKNKAPDLFDCGYKKGQEAFANGRQEITVENILCKAFQFNAACQRTELRPCGCPTVRAYESISRDLLYPPACPRPILPDPPVQCNKLDPMLFEDPGNGAENVRAFSSVSCIFVLGIAFSQLYAFVVL